MELLCSLSIKFDMGNSNYFSIFSPNGSTFNFMEKCDMSLVPPMIKNERQKIFGETNFISHFFTKLNVKPFRAKSFDAKCGKIS